MGIQQKKDTFSLVENRAIETLLTDYQLNEKHFFYLLESDVYCNGSRKKIPVGELKRSADRFKDELEEFSFIVKDNDAPIPIDDRRDILCYFSNIISDLTILISDYGHIWDEEMKDIIQGHLIIFKSLYTISIFGGTKQVFD